MKISTEKRRFLDLELKEYKKVTPMTEEERKALKEWVQAGNSVHENGAMASYEGGKPMDFLDVYRKEEDLRRMLDTMSYEEGSRYLLEEYGIDRDRIITSKSLTYDELVEKSNHLYRTCRLYWEFLAANGLCEEVYIYIREHGDKEEPFGSFQWDTAQ